MRAVLPFVLLPLAACATFPEVDAAERGIVRGPAPILLPTDDMIARTDLAQTDETTGATLAARAAALQARAEDLRAAAGDPGV